MSKPEANGLSENQDDEIQRLKKPKRWSCCMMGCATPLALILIFVVVMVVWRYRSHYRLVAIETEIASRGEPINAEELAEYYCVTEGVEEKTHRFEGFDVDWEEPGFIKLPFTHLPIIGDEDAEPPPLDSELPWPQHDEVRTFLDEHADLIERAEVAALAEGEVRFPVDFSFGIGTLLPYTFNMRHYANLLELNARTSLYQGDELAAHRSILAILGLAEALKREPLALTQLVRTRIRAQAIRFVCDALPIANWSDEQIRTIQQAATTPDWRASVKRAVIGDRALLRENFGQIEALMVADADVVALHYASGDHDTAYFLETMTRLVEATDQEFHEMIAEHVVIMDHFEAENTTYSKAFTRPYSAYLTPKMDAFTISAAKASALDQGVATQIALELYRRKHSELPKELNDLVPDFLPTLPLDPFAGDSLIYRISDDSLIVYSVGEDLIDDDGDVTDDFGIAVTTKLLASP